MKWLVATFLCSIVGGGWVQVSSAQTERTQIPSSKAIHGRDGAPMVLVSEGPFIMGQNRTVHLNAFYIDRFEVTNELYDRFVQATGTGRTSPYARDKRFNGPRHPIVGVSWFDAKAYCQWAGKRLPTEAEWEKAARGPNGYDPTANRPNLEVPMKNLWANFRPKIALGYEFYHTDPDADGFRFTAPVGSFRKEGGPYGIYDMAGNVWEWVADIYPTSEVLARKSQFKELKVQRGGSWLNMVQLLSPTYRRWSNPNLRGDSAAGFRCAKDAQ